MYFAENHLIFIQANFYNEFQNKGCDDTPKLAKQYTCMFKLHFSHKITVDFQFHIFYFLLPMSRGNIVFGSNFRSGDFDGFTRFEVP